MLSLSFPPVAVVAHVTESSRKADDHEEGVGEEKEEKEGAEGEENKGLSNVRKRDIVKNYGRRMFRKVQYV